MVEANRKRLTEVNMVRHKIIDFSELWKNIPWKKFRRNLFRLQRRLFKAIQAEDTRRARNIQKLILKSKAARLLAVRQVSQLNTGKKTAGIDGIKSLNFKQRYALEPAHEALFHARSYGFRPGRSTHDAQKILFLNLKSDSNGLNKRILELDIEKCFDRINHTSIMERVIAPQTIKTGIWRCLKAGVNPEFPEQGTPQGGVVSPLLANVALDGIEDIHYSIRYADDTVVILKPKDDADKILKDIQEFLAARGLKVSEKKTKLVRATEGFDFLGWHFKVQTNGKFRCVPSEDNYRTFRQKVKDIVNCSNYGAKVKAKKLAPLVRGWRNYHRYCKMDGSRFSLWRTAHRAFKVFNKEKKLNRYTATELIKKAFPAVPYSKNRHVNVKSIKSPYDGDTVYPM